MCHRIKSYLQKLVNYWVIFSYSNVNDKDVLRLLWVHHICVQNLCKKKEWVHNNRSILNICLIYEWNYIIFETYQRHIYRIITRAIRSTITKLNSITMIMFVGIINITITTTTTTIVIFYNFSFLCLVWINTIWIKFGAIISTLINICARVKFLGIIYMIFIGSRTIWMMRYTNINTL
jgi:hypothetical protein